MKVEVQCSINSGQYDKGDVVDLPEATAKIMIQAGTAKKAGGASKVDKPKEQAREIPKRPKPSKTKE